MAGQQRLFTYSKKIFNKEIINLGIPDDFRKAFIKKLTKKKFSYQNFQSALINFEQSYKIDERDEKHWLDKIKWIADSYLEIFFKKTNSISQRVIFPLTEREKNGIEDVSFVLFQEDDGDYNYYGTYTAYDGRTVLPKLIKTKDFKFFEIKPLQGEKTFQKNFALFPRKINQHYVMLSRLDGYNHYLMYSDNIYMWNHATKIKIKKNHWEIIQVGNCGSPIETSSGWLVLTHGVGAMRKYCLGAMLLDLENPQQVLGTLKEPLMYPLENERDGYVPNVIYTCGALSFKDKLIIPYACSDTKVFFATLSMENLLKELKKNKN
jgi:predicted GH43/DUF377 family glycosyl hydrolase